MTRSATYIRLELLRTFRNRRFFFLGLAFPLILYFVIATPNRHEHDLAHTGISAPLYFMVGLASFGAMNAMLSSGARIAAERSAGWQRQLRITPLSTRVYFRTKVLTGYAMAVLTILLLYAAGLMLGVHLGAGTWLRMTELILIGLLPFAALGILMGHLLTTDSIGPAMGGMTALLAIFGGTWFPISSHGAMHDIAQGLPSYWLVQASRVALGAHGWGTEGWVVLAAWTLVLTALARGAYRRDTVRV